jgi:hypothetical protein
MEAAQWGPKAEVVIVDRRDFLPREARVGGNHGGRSGGIWIIYTERQAKFQLGSSSYCFGYYFVHGKLCSERTCAMCTSCTRLGSLVVK